MPFVTRANLLAGDALADDLGVSVDEDLRGRLGEASEQPASEHFDNYLLGPAQLTRSLYELQPAEEVLEAQVLDEARPAVHEGGHRDEQEAEEEVCLGERGLRLRHHLWCPG